MKAQSKTKKVTVAYKGWHLTQVPWKSYEGQQYARYYFNPDGEITIHAGRCKYSTRKELRLDLIQYVNRDRERLLKMMEAINAK